VQVAELPEEVAALLVVLAGPVETAAVLAEVAGAMTASSLVMLAHTWVLAGAWGAMMACTMGKPDRTNLRPRYRARGRFRRCNFLCAMLVAAKRRRKKQKK